MQFIRKIVRYLLSSKSNNRQSVRADVSKKTKIQQAIDNDPQIKKIDKEIEKIHSQYKISPEMVELLKKYGAL
jgi:hypothetical protein